ncbi:NRDE family protein [Deferribacter autotrophicus]|uniref:NRDE family protein n=1 Tax=Deferribacter autotrophicus TaxID=500465 RepID=A0A5A8F2C5_9BACT|nr:NRDE family protein [Deferribacter autotrophicus]KAA0257953.1 NRDE family protein [Deferribacter autotrophicus]
MCIYAFAVNPNKNYKFILVGNRDEFYDRKALPAHFWKEYLNLLAGKDLKEQGTWLGITKTGKIAFLTNYRNPTLIKHNAPSRGFIVKNFLTSDVPIQKYATELYSRKDIYNGFNLVFGTINDLYYYSNIGGLNKINEGTHTLGNAFLDTKWPKCKKLENYLNTILYSDKIDLNTIFNYLEDETKADDSELPDTKIGYEKEKLLSSIFVKSDTYGTIFSYFIYVNKDNQVFFAEKDQLSNKITTYKFTINKYSP